MQISRAAEMPKGLFNILYFGGECVLVWKKPGGRGGLVGVGKYLAQHEREGRAAWIVAGEILKSDVLRHSVEALQGDLCIDS